MISYKSIIDKDNLWPYKSNQLIYLKSPSNFPSGLSLKTPSITVPFE